MTIDARRGCHAVPIAKRNDSDVVATKGKGDLKVNHEIVVKMGQYSFLYILRNVPFTHLSPNGYHFKTTNDMNNLPNMFGKDPPPPGRPL
jgi:hypothetical protein